MKKILFTFLSIICLTFYARATHITGGSLNLVWLHDSTYNLQLSFFRDCNSQTVFDDLLSVGIFSKSTNTRMAVISMNRGSTTLTPFDTNSCFNTPSLLCQEVAYYSKVITLSPGIYTDSNGYYISYERCCRDISIQNIKTPGAIGITLYTEIPSPNLLNNSTPKWSNVLNKVLCKRENFSYNFNFIDADGDSLYYTLVNPIEGNSDQNLPTNNGNPQSGPYPRIAWEYGYDSLHHINGNPPLTIDNFDGTISINPDTVGTYASAIRVEEFRSGKKIGETRLELLFHVLQLGISGSLGISKTSPNKATSSSCYPNPFSENTIFKYTLQEKGNVKLTVYDLLGREVKKVVDEEKQSGTFLTEFESNDINAGIYFADFLINDIHQVIKLFVTK